MSIRRFAFALGLVFLAIGGAGFVPALVEPAGTGHRLAMDVGHDMLLGMFPVNHAHNVVHILFGIWGVGSSRSSEAARRYARGVAYTFAGLTVAGFVPHFDTLFGLMPLYGNDIWLHVGLALVGAYFGWVHRGPAPVEISTQRTPETL